MKRILTTAAKLLFCVGVLLGVVLSLGETGADGFPYAFLMLVPQIAIPVFLVATLYVVALKGAERRRRATYPLRQGIALAAVAAGLLAVFAVHWLAFNYSGRGPIALFHVTYWAWLPWAGVTALLLPLLTSRGADHVTQ